MGWDWSTSGLESYVFTITVPSERGQTLWLSQERWDDPFLTARDDSFCKCGTAADTLYRLALSLKLRKPLVGASMATHSEALPGVSTVHQFCLPCLALQVLLFSLLWTTCSDFTPPVLFSLWLLLPPDTKLLDSSQRPKPWCQFIL